MENCIIELKDVNKIIRGNHILKDINLTVYGGEICGFIGRNASGKSMLFKCITNLVTISSGELKVFGNTFTHYYNANRYIGALIEHPGFLGNLSGFQNLKAIASIRGIIDDQRIKETMETLELDSTEKKQYRKYSLGMRQKLGIAAAIMEKPQIVVLDEPTNNIDAESVETVKKVLLQLNHKEKTTILLASHHIDDIESLCNKKYILENGILTGRQ